MEKGDARPPISARVLARRQVVGRISSSVPEPQATTTCTRRSWAHTTRLDHDAWCFTISFIGCQALLHLTLPPRRPAPPLMPSNSLRSLLACVWLTRWQLTGSRRTSGTIVHAAPALLYVRCHNQGRSSNKPEPPSSICLPFCVCVCVLCVRSSALPTLPSHVDINYIYLSHALPCLFVCLRVVQTECDAYIAR
jgi:hypothetical protein